MLRFIVVSSAATSSVRKKPPTLPHRHPRRTREEHSQETAQDYVEIIADLIGTTGEARVIDLARRLGVTHVTVARTIQRLQREGLVTNRPYRSIFLTASGSKLSKESRRRHEIVVQFLESLGVPAHVAHSDAEGIEHHVSAETLRAFVTHLRKSKLPDKKPLR
ncbi:MAG TPA: manganese-binding transcriptional regulator MntR [Chthoniobacterales bacterium]|nr:manganese-binding transcriptional regulator MntR [Chthoniobacterales bacterium]